MVTNNIPSLSPNPSSLKRRFAQGFLRALTRIQNRNRNNPAKPRAENIERRRRRVRAASDAALASAVGPTRVWSRAVLRRKKIISRFASRWNSAGRELALKKKKIIMKKAGKREKCFVGLAGHERKLRRVVPGGEEMDVYSLLEETFHYIKCLKTQVNVMKRIADQICSTTS